MFCTVYYLAHQGSQNQSIVHDKTKLYVYVNTYIKIFMHCTDTFVFFNTSSFKKTLKLFLTTLPQ